MVIWSPTLENVAWFREPLKLFSSCLHYFTDNLLYNIFNRKWAEVGVNYIVDYLAELQFLLDFYVSLNYTIHIYIYIITTAPMLTEISANDSWNLRLQDCTKWCIVTSVYLIIPFSNILKTILTSVDGLLKIQQQNNIQMLSL